MLWGCPHLVDVRDGVVDVLRGSRRRDCHFTDTPCLSLLKYLQQVQGEGAIKWQSRRRLGVTDCLNSGGVTISNSLALSHPVPLQASMTSRCSCCRRPSPSCRGSASGRTPHAVRGGPVQVTTRTITRHDGPDHLGLWYNMDIDGPNHLIQPTRWP